LHSCFYICIFNVLFYDMQIESQCSVLPALAEVIKLKDTSMMALEISVSGFNS
jgi:hypothetical protein